MIGITATAPDFAIIFVAWTGPFHDSPGHPVFGFRETELASEQNHKQKDLHQYYIFGMLLYDLKKGYWKIREL